MPFQWKGTIFPTKKTTDSKNNNHSHSSIFHIITGKSRKKRITPCNHNDHQDPQQRDFCVCNNNGNISKNTILQPVTVTIDNGNVRETVKNTRKRESSSSKSATSGSASSSLDICKEVEIMTYITHLDESNYNQSDFPVTLILPNQHKNTGIEAKKSIGIPETFLEPSNYYTYKSNSDESLKTNYSSEDSLKTYWGSASEKTNSDASETTTTVIRVGKTSAAKQHNKMSIKPKLQKSTTTKRDKALRMREAVWENIDVILENFGLTFLDLVSNAMMLLTVNMYNHNSKNRVCQIPDIPDISRTEEVAFLPKIIVMIDDPPIASESANNTMGRLISVELYLLGLKLFVIPCYNFAPHVFNFMMKGLLDDSKLHRNFDSAYNFILKTGFTQLLKRSDTDVIIFDGDWLRGDVCQLIALAENSGHEVRAFADIKYAIPLFATSNPGNIFSQLIFMKNHQGIKKLAFVQIVVAKIRTRLNEFDDLRLATTPSVGTSISIESASEKPNLEDFLSSKQVEPSTGKLERTEILRIARNILEGRSSNSCHVLKSKGPTRLTTSRSSPAQILPGHVIIDEHKITAHSVSSTLTRRTQSLLSYTYH